MASNNEAKIKFTADTSDFNDAIKSAKDETKQLNAEMRLNEAQFKNTGDAAEYLQKKHDLLEAKLEANQKQQEALNQKIEVATEYYGENSTEVQKLESQLTNAEIAEQKILTQITDVNGKISEQQEEAEKNASALGELTTKIDEQETELADLKEQYVNAVLEFGETSEEAQGLASEIESLSSELTSNKEELETAKEQADQLAQSFSDTSDESGNTLSALEELTSTIADQESELASLKEEYVNAVLQFGESSSEAQSLSSEIQTLSAELSENKATLEDAKGKADEYDNSMGGIGDMASKLPGPLGDVAGGITGIANAFVTGGVIGLTGELVDKAVELGKAAWEMANEWQEAEGSIATGTGLVGDALDDMTQKAYEAAGAIADVNFDGKTSSDVIAELNTRLGLTGDEAKETTAEIAKFAKANGEDAVPAVDTIVNLMHRYGLETKDMPALLDKLTIAQQGTQYSASDMADAVEKNAPSFKGLGMNLDDALSYMMAFADYSDTTYQSAMTGTKKAVTVLSDATKDVPGAFNEALKVMQSGSSLSTILATEVGNTGKTISDVFGKRAAQDMVDFFQNSGKSTGDYVSALQNCDGQMQTTYENTVTWKDENKQVLNSVKGYFFDMAGGIKDAMTGADGDVSKANSSMSTSFTAFGSSTKKTSDNSKKAIKSSYDDMAKSVISSFSGMKKNASEKFGSFKSNVESNASKFKENISNFGSKVKENVTTKFSDMKEKAVDSFSNLKEKASSKMSDLKSSVSDKVEAMKDKFKSFGSTAKNRFLGALDSIKSKIGDKWSSIKEKMSGWLGKIKDLFKFNWKLPKPKLPKISWEWKEIADGLLKIPTFKIEWHAKGGVFNQPTLLQSNQGSIHGVGDAGPEAIAPISTLQSYIKDAFPAFDYDLLANKIAGAVGDAGGIQIVVNGSAGMSVNDLADAVEKRIVSLQKQRRTAWT